MLKQYYLLCKPGIIYGNAITAIAGYLYATSHSFSIIKFIGTILGIALVIGSACVANNYFDRTVDQNMSRTKRRPLVTKVIAPVQALLILITLGLVGFALLYFSSNILTVGLGIVGYVDYVCVYTHYKKLTRFGTILGSVSGAIPVTAGYTAVADSLNTKACLLFLILVLWQMPHFYAIAIGRLKDYQNAQIPVLPSVRGVRKTKNVMIVYLILFLAASVSLSLLGLANIFYGIVMTGVGLTWLWLGIQGLSSVDDVPWAKRIFRFSLLVILLFSIALSLGTKLG